MTCLWDDEWDGPAVRTVVPDGCVDLIWVGGELVVDGPDTGPRRTPLSGITSGIRVRAGAAGEFLGIPASEVRDLRVRAEDLWNESGARWHGELLAAPPTRIHELLAAPPTRIHELLAAAVAERGATPDPLVRAAIPRLASPEARVSAVAFDLGVSERHLHRRCMSAVGYGPKTFARVARLRRLMRPSDRLLAERAIDAGYASQAHMNAEVRRLTGETPVRLLKDGAPVRT